MESFRAACLILLMTGCQAPTSAPAARERSAPLAEEEPPREQPTCTPGEIDEPLQLALDPGESGLVHDLSANSSLRVLVTNLSSSHGTVHLRATSISGAGRRESALTEVRVQAGETVAVSLSARDLDLADGPFDFSGTLSIDGALAYEGGRSNDVLLNLFFHPTVAGWQIYDAAAWAATFDRGILTERARAARAEANAVAAAISERDGIPTSVVAIESFEVPGDGR